MMITGRRGFKFYLDGTGNHSLSRILPPTSTVSSQSIIDMRHGTSLCLTTPYYTARSVMVTPLSDSSICQRWNRCKNSFIIKKHNHHSHFSTKTTILRVNKQNNNKEQNDLLLMEKTNRIIDQIPNFNTNDPVLIAQINSIVNEWIEWIEETNTDSINTNNNDDHPLSTLTMGLTVEQLLSSYLQSYQNEKNDTRNSITLVADNNHENNEEAIQDNERTLLKLYSLIIEVWIHCITISPKQYITDRHENNENHQDSCLQKAEEWLSKFLSKNIYNTQLPPSEDMFHSKLNSSIAIVLHALCKISKQQQQQQQQDGISFSLLERADSIMETTISRVFHTCPGHIISPEKKEEHHNYNGFLLPNTTVWNSFIHVYTCKGDESSLEKAKNLLHYMIQKWETESYNNLNIDEPNHVTFNSIIHGYAKSGDTKSAEDVLHLWNQYSDRLSAAPDKTTLNSIMDAYSKSNAANASINAENLLLLWMQNNENQNTGDLNENDEFRSKSPDKVTFTSLIDTFAKHGDAEKAQGILYKMIELYELGDVDMNPDVYTYSSVLKSWLNQPQSSSRNNNHPNEIIKQCSEIIQLMETRYRNGHMDESQALTVVYNTFIQVIGQSKIKNKATKVLDILQYMLRRNKDSGSSMFNPNIETYNEVLSILGKNGNNLKEIEKIYNHVSKDPLLSFNIITVNSYLDALSRTRNKHAPHLALKTLKEIEEKSNSSNVYPNTRTYNTVMNVLSKSGPIWCERAERILDLMETNMLKGNSSVKPNTISYSTCINAWSKSTSEDKAEKALLILKRMENAYTNGMNPNAEPSIFAYNGVLNACAFTKTNNAERKGKCLALANDVFNQVLLLQKQESSKVNADEITYATMMKACINLYDVKKGTHLINLLNPIVKECCKHGYLGPMTIKELKYALTESQYHKLLGKDLQQNPGWSRNIASRPPKKRF